jgi:predicted NBD/HSP70 family sugar kinase
MLSLGIDIGGTCVKAAARENNKTLWTGQSEFYAAPNTDALQTAIRQAVNNHVKQIGPIGLCVPGLFDAEQRIITAAVNVPGLVGIPLDRLVPDSLGLAATGKARICNDANASAFDLFTSRQMQGRLLVLALGTGIGMSVLDDGKALIVESESSGHIGQIDVSIPGHDVIGPDGGAGGLEGYLGVAALRATYGNDVSAAVAKFTGDEPALQSLVRAIRITHAIYRPNHVCLCGGIGIRMKHLLPKLRKMIDKNLTSLAQPDWTLTTGDDDFHAARGAALLAIDASGSHKFESSKA